MLTGIVALLITAGSIITAVLYGLPQIKGLTRILIIMQEAILRLTVCREERLRRLTIRYSIPFQPEEVLKADQVIHRVPITTLLQAADHPVLNQEVPILRVLHRGHPLVHHQVLHRVLHQAGDN